MFVVADTHSLVEDQIITPDVAKEIQVRARGIMVSLAINALLCFGILAATGGLIFWLANAMAVAIVGIGLLVVGLGILAKSNTTYAMFGNAAALIGAGMLMGGGAIELVDTYENVAGPAMFVLGAIVTVIAGRAFVKGGLTTRFVQGAILLMGLAMHLFGLGFWGEQNDLSGWPLPLFHGYCAAAIFAAGYLTDVRFVSALAIVPFAQMLDTGTFYVHAAYVFYSPESTLSILQLVLLMGVLTWWMAGRGETAQRHGGILRLMAFIVANLCALVGSLWGDWIGETLWGPGWRRASGLDYEDWKSAKEAFEANALYISEGTYTILWAVVLALILAWAAHHAQRGLFNTAMTFAGIHAYTQLFESFWDEPLAYVIGGFAAIPVAWGMWRLNTYWSKSNQPGGI